MTGSTSGSDRQQAIVAALSSMRVQGPDADVRARAKDRLMLLLTAEPTRPAPASSAIAS